MQSIAPLGHHLHELTSCMPAARCVQSDFLLFIPYLSSSAGVKQATAPSRAQLVNGSMA